MSEQRNLIAAKADREAMPSTAAPPASQTRRKALRLQRPISRMPIDPAELSGYSAHLRHTGSDNPRGYSSYDPMQAALAPTRVDFAVRPGCDRSAAELRNCAESRDLLLL